MSHQQKILDHVFKHFILNRKPFVVGLIRDSGVMAGIGQDSIAAAADLLDDIQEAHDEASQHSGRSDKARHMAFEAALLQIAFDQRLADPRPKRNELWAREPRERLTARRRAR